MYPNPQDALPLPPRPNLAQYRKLAKDLVKACKSSDATSTGPGDPDAILDWARQWIETLAALARAEPDAPRNAHAITVRADQVARFARQKLTGSGRHPSPAAPHSLPAAADVSTSRPSTKTDACRLADAQFVVARAHGFTSWPALAAHIDALALASSPVSTFESAAHAIVSGDVATLIRLLRAHPHLIRARSTREHRATLLHHVAANGVENYRQVTPRNIAEIAGILLAAGAEVDAEADVYGGGATTLGLVATSVHPANAGVQQALIDMLLAHGARLDRPGGGNKHTLVRGCLANGQPEAAEYLERRGAPIDLPGACGLGRLDLVQRFFDDNGGLNSTASTAQMAAGFSLACGYGRVNVVEFLLDRGMDVDALLDDYGEGHTGLHVAAFQGHAAIVDALRRRGARVDAIDKTWGTPPLVWALTGWSRKPARDAARYYDVVTRLVQAGASVTPELLESDEVRADPEMLAALSPKHARD